MGIVHVIQKFCSHKERCMYKELNGPIVMKCKRCDKAIDCSKGFISVPKPPITKE